jgi:23S rRNA G2445 N2-methylase RlmL
VLGIAALAQGARSLLALDINPAAIETTALNLRALGFADRAEARHSDAFSALKPGELFDVIIFAAPYWDRPAMDFLEKSCFDTSYKFFGEAVQDAHHWLAQDGSMYVIFSDQGDVNHALGLIENSNVRVHKTHLVRPTKHGGHIRIIWELRHADILGMSNEPTANGGTSSP